MTENMNMGSTLVLLTLENGQTTLVNIQKVKRFDGFDDGSHIIYETLDIKFVKEDPKHIRQLITASKAAEFKEIMEQMMGAQGKMMKDLLGDKGMPGL